MNVVIMAGGGGTRLWPLSRRQNPKQFIDLGSGKTLLQQTYDRACAITDPADIYVATTAEFGPRLQALLPALKSDHFFIEPQRRDTAPAIATVAQALQGRGAGARPTIFMWADHVFTEEAAFIAALRRLKDLVARHPDHVVILGHRPTSPETGLGYIEAASPVPGEPDVFVVAGFKEKPDAATAERYLLAGNFFWNMGYVSATPHHLLTMLRQHAPDLMAGVDRYAVVRQHGDAAAVASAYGALPKISIDYALLEKAHPLLVLTGDFGWSDVGNWAAVQEVFGLRGDHTGHGHHVHVDSKNNYVFNASGQTVSLVGLRDTIVVVTGDAILITSRGSAARVKEVVARLEEEGKDHVL